MTHSWQAKEEKTWGEWAQYGLLTSIIVITGGQWLARHPASRGMKANLTILYQPNVLAWREWVDCGVSEMHGDPALLLILGGSDGRLCPGNRLVGVVILLKLFFEEINQFPQTFTLCWTSGFDFREISSKCPKKHFTSSGRGEDHSAIVDGGLFLRAVRNGKRMVNHNDLL